MLLSPLFNIGEVVVYNDKPATVIKCINLNDLGDILIQNYRYYVIDRQGITWSVPEENLDNARYVRRKRQNIHSTSKGIKNAKQSFLRASSAMPSWVDQRTIISVYSNVPKGCVVDHIIPLQHKDVCGLHVAWNLQYLTPSANGIKKNKFTPE